MARRPSKLLSKLQIPDVSPEHDSRIKHAQEIIGREFSVPGLLQVALTHPSYVKHTKSGDNY